MATSQLNEGATEGRIMRGKKGTPVSYMYQRRMQDLSWFI